MGDIFERKDKGGKTRYTARTRRKGCKPITKTFGRRTDAKIWLTKTEAALIENRDFPEREEGKHTVNDLIKIYKKNGFADKPGSKDKQTKQLDWWADRLGHLLLKDLTPKKIAKAIEELQKSKNRYGKPISNSTVNRYKSALSAMLTYANEKNFWMSRNPARLIRQLKENKGRERYLSEKEFHSLIRALKQVRNKKLLPLFLLSISTGLRRSEALRTEWNHINFNERTLRVPTSKNGEPRILPIGELAWKYILMLWETRRPGSKLIFHGNNVNKPMNFDTAWSSVLAKAGIEDFRWHDNRHTAAVFFRKSGLSIADIADILGHKTLTVSWRYAKYKTEEQRPKIAAMTSAFMPEDLVEKAQNVDHDEADESV